VKDSEDISEEGENGKKVKGKLKKKTDSPQISLQSRGKY